MTDTMAATTYGKSDSIPISRLEPQSKDVPNASFKAVATVIWPFSSSQRTLAVLLADPDFRLRKSRGQLRVIFHGPAAEAAMQSGLGSGDKVTVYLEGSRWEAAESNNVSTPGKGIDWDLTFTSRLLMQINKQDIKEAVSIDLNVSPESLSTSTSYDTTNTLLSTPLSAERRFASLYPTITDAYQSPAFLQSKHLDSSSAFQSSFDPFDGSHVNGTQREKKRLKLWGGNRRWTYSQRSPSPTRSSSAHQSDENKDMAGSVMQEDILLSVLGANSRSPTPSDQEIPVEIHVNGSTGQEATGQSQGVTENGLYDHLPMQIPSWSDRTVPPASPRLAPISSPGLPLISPMPVKAIVKLQELTVNHTDLDLTKGDEDHELRAHTTIVSGDERQSIADVSRGDTTPGRYLGTFLGHSPAVQYPSLDRSLLFGEGQYDHKTSIPQATVSPDEEGIDTDGSIQSIEEYPERNALTIQPFVPNSHESPIVIDSSDSEAISDNAESNINLEGPSDHLSETASDVDEDIESLGSDVSEIYSSEVDEGIDTLGSTLPEVHSPEANEDIEDIETASPEPLSAEKLKVSSESEPEEFSMQVSPQPYLMKEVEYEEIVSELGIRESPLEVSSSTESSPEPEQTNLLSAADYEADDEDNDSDSGHPNLDSDLLPSDEATGGVDDPWSREEDPIPVDDNLNTLERGNSLSLSDLAESHASYANGQSHPATEKQTFVNLSTSPDIRNEGTTIPDIQTAHQLSLLEDIEEPLQESILGGIDIAEDVMRKMSSSVLSNPVQQNLMEISVTESYTRAAETQQTATTSISQTLRDDRESMATVEMESETLRKEEERLPSPRSDMEGLSSNPQSSHKENERFTRPSSDVEDLLSSPPSLQKENTSIASDLREGPDEVVELRDQVEAERHSESESELRKEAESTEIEQSSEEKIEHQARQDAEPAPEDGTKPDLGPIEESTSQPEIIRRFHSNSPPSHKPVESTMPSTEDIPPPPSIPITGIITPRAEFPPLSKLRPYLHKSIDILAIVTSHKPAERAAGGPKDFVLTLTISDPSIHPLGTGAVASEAESSAPVARRTRSGAGSVTGLGSSLPSEGVTVTIIRPYKKALPVVTDGDGLLLRDFRVQPIRRSLGLSSAENSAWAVYRGEGRRGRGKNSDRVWVTTGPPVEWGKEERETLNDLKAWWEWVCAMNKAEEEKEK